MQNIKTHIDLMGADLDISVIRIEGLIDTDTSRNVSKVIEEIIKSKCVKIVVDLSKVDYISSAGWGIFIGELRNLRESGGDLKLADLTSEVEDIYRLLEFYNVLAAYNSVEEALKDFNK